MDQGCHPVLVIPQLRCGLENCCFPLALLLTVQCGHHRAGLISTFSGTTRSLWGFLEGRELQTPGKRPSNNVQCAPRWALWHFFFSFRAVFSQHTKAIRNFPRHLPFISNTAAWVILLKYKSKCPVVSPPSRPPSAYHLTSFPIYCAPSSSRPGLLRAP